MGRRCASIASRESTWLPSKPTMLPFSANGAAMATAPRRSHATMICSYSCRMPLSTAAISEILHHQGRARVTGLRLAPPKPTLLVKADRVGIDDRLHSPAAQLSREFLGALDEYPPVPAPL